MAVPRLRRDDVVYSDLGSEIVLLDLRSSTYFSVRETGAVLLTRLVDGASVDALVRHLVATYGIDEMVARVDVDEFIADLAGRELIEYVHA